MEVMEDGNLMDKVNILIQRDMEYYKVGFTKFSTERRSKFANNLIAFQAKQSVLQETICPGIIGGKLDFPRSASFAAVKLAVWWEEEYVAAYRKPSGGSFVISVDFGQSTCCRTVSKSGQRKSRQQRHFRSMRRNCPNLRSFKIYLKFK